MAQTIAYEGANGKPQQVDAAHPLPVNATVTATASTVAKATAAAPSYSEGDVAAPLSVDLAGGLRITGTINATSATTNTAAAPSYSEGTSNAFSANLAGDLRVIAKQSGTWVIGAGSALIGSTSIDQTTPGTTNAVSATNFPTTLTVNSGNKDNSTIRVVEATDAPAQAARGTAATGAAVPSGAIYLGASVAGTLTGLVATANGLKVDVIASALPSGAATSAKQPALGTAGSASADVITVQGIASMTALKVDGSAVTQPVSIATAPVLVAGSAVIGKVGIDQTTPGTTNLVAAGQNGTWTVQPGNTANTTPWLVTSGHGKTIKTAPISAITADTDVVAAVTSKRIKVIAYALFTTGTSASTLAFKSNGAAGTLLANVMLQSQASAIFGANLAVPAPSFLFATVAGEKLTLDVGNTDPITGFITYFDDDAT